MIITIFSGVIMKNIGNLSKRILAISLLFLCASGIYAKKKAAKLDPELAVTRLAPVQRLVL